MDFGLMAGSSTKHHFLRDPPHPPLFIAEWSQRIFTSVQFQCHCLLNHLKFSSWQLKNGPFYTIFVFFYLFFGRLLNLFAHSWSRKILSYFWYIQKDWPYFANLCRQSHLIMVLIFYTTTKSIMCFLWSWIEEEGSYR